MIVLTVTITTEFVAASWNESSPVRRFGHVGVAVQRRVEQQLGAGVGVLFVLEAVEHRPEHGEEEHQGDEPGNQSDQRVDATAFANPQSWNPSCDLFSLEQPGQHAQGDVGDDDRGDDHDDGVRRCLTEDPAAADRTLIDEVGQVGRVPVPRRSSRRSGRTPGSGTRSRAGRRAPCTAADAAGSAGETCRTPWHRRPWRLRERRTAGSAGLPA